jgi:hypothetical protein
MCHCVCWWFESVCRTGHCSRSNALLSQRTDRSAVTLTSNPLPPSFIKYFHPIGWVTAALNIKLQRLSSCTSAGAWTVWRHTHLWNMNGAPMCMNGTGGISSGETWITHLYIVMNIAMDYLYSVLQIILWAGASHYVSDMQCQTSLIAAFGSLISSWFMAISFTFSRASSFFRSWQSFSWQRSFSRLL